MSRFWKHPRLALALALALPLAGCDALGLAPRARLELKAPSAPAERVLLKGRVQLAQRKVQASLDLFRNAPMVILLNDAAGVTRASGIATADGAFTIYKSTQPYTFQSGAFYHLVAVKRSNTEDGRVMTLRTLLKRVGDGWTSLTGPTPVLSLATTALAQLATEQALAFDDVMNALDDAGAALRLDVGGQPLFTAVSEGTLTSRREEVTAKLGADIDPGGPRLVIEGDYTVLDLAGLESIAAVTEVKGCLSIFSAGGQPGSPNEIKLPFLKKVGALYIEGDFSSVAGLAELEEIGRSPLPATVGHVTAAPGSLLLNLSGAIDTLTGLERIREVHGDLMVKGSQLTSLAPLSHVTRVGGELKIQEMHQLTGLSFADLAEIGGGLTVEGNPLLTSISAPLLRHVGGDMTFSWNKQLPQAQVNALHGALTGYTGQLSTSCLLEDACL